MSATAGNRTDDGAAGGAGMVSAEATRLEMLAIAISAYLRDEDVGFTGLTTGRNTALFATMVPLAAMEYARQTHAPNLTSLLAGWCHNAELRQLDDVPGAEFDPLLLRLDADAHDMAYPFMYSLRRGDVTVGFSSAAQIDRVGNLNTTVIGDLANPKVRLVGPILVPDHLAFFGREIVMMPRHDARSFVQRVDHISGVGFPEGREGRERAGVPGAGPVLVVTPRCLFEFGDDGVMSVASVHPGVTPEEIVEHTGFEPRGLDRAPQTPQPTQEELAQFRELVDPHGLLREELE
jgi:glutaconate CoA-transferase, subunit B